MQSIGEIVRDIEAVYDAEHEDIRAAVYNFAVQLGEDLVEGGRRAAGGDNYEVTDEIADSIREAFEAGPTLSE